MTLMLLKNPCFSFSCFHKNPCFLLQKNCLSPPFPPSTPPLRGQKVSPPLEPFLGIQQFLRHFPPPLEKSRRPCVTRASISLKHYGEASPRFFFPLSSAEGSKKFFSRNGGRNKYSASQETRFANMWCKSACLLCCVQTNKSSQSP